MSQPNKTKATILTVLVSIASSILVMGFNLIYNNLIIKIYGSSINGLISTLTQFVSLFTIIEGGFGVASVVAVYEPIVKKDYKKLNDILYTSKVVFNTISLIFTISIIICGMIYLQFIDSPLNKIETYSLLLLTMMVTTISMGVYNKHQIVISGNNKAYLLNYFTILSRTITWCISILLILLRINIVLVYSLNVVYILFVVLLLKIHEKKEYKYVTYKGKFDIKLIKGTKDVFFQKLASCFFSSTDLILISAALSLSIASVYNLYNQIFHAIFSFLINIVQAPFNSFGQLVNEDNDDKLYKLFSVYQRLMLFISTIFLTVVGMSILSFVKIYVHGVKDAEYVYPSLVLLFYTQFFLQFNNRPYGILLNVSGNFKKQNFQCGLAAVINLAFSIIMVNYWGIQGVILGSVLGTLIILVFNVIQSYKNVLQGKCLRDIMLLIVNYILGILLISISLMKVVDLESYFYWIIYAVLNFAVASFIILAINFIIDRSKTKMAIVYAVDLVKTKLVHR